MNRPLIFSLAALALGTIPTLIVAQEPCDTQFVVSQVNLPATVRLSQSEQAAIRAGLVGRCFDDRQLGELAGTVRDKLQSLGYLRATVAEPTLAITDASRHPQPISLNIEVREGARYKVREIEWRNLKAVSVEQVMAVSPVQIDDVIDMSKLPETVETVRRLYAANGYPKASILPQVQFQEAGHGVAVIFRVTEGAQSP
jgi:outer membrane protein assembly factor BamA